MYCINARIYFNFGRSSVNGTNEVGLRCVWSVQAAHLENVSTWTVLGLAHFLGHAAPWQCRKGCRKRIGGSQTIEFGRIILSVCWESSPDLTGCDFGGSGSQCFVLPWVVGGVEQAFVFVPTLASAGEIWGSKRGIVYNARIWKLLFYVFLKQKRVELFWKAGALG